MLRSRPSSWTLFLALLTIVTTCGTFADALCACNHRTSVLVAFFVATNGPSWDAPWNTNIADGPCVWAGVTCGAASNDVDRLELAGRGLSGTLPEVLAELTRMDFFNISSNRVSGAIPNSIASWNQTIRTFDVSRNQLTGTLPSSLASWSAFTKFDAYQNSLTGTLPPEYGAWGSLGAAKRTINVRHNRLVGTLPEEYANWGESASFFDVEGNGLNGTIPSAWSTWKNLVFFSVLNNRVRGTLPPTLSNWSFIIDFKVSDNDLEGTLPSEYATWGAALLNFAAAKNRLEGTLPPEYRAWVRLRECFIDGNYFTGTIPSEYAEWGASLISLQIQDNLFSGTLSSSFGAWTSMERFYSLNNSLSGTLPEALSRWVALRLFRISINRFSGTLSPTFQSWIHIDSFEIEKNRFVGTLPPEFSAWRSIVKFLVNDNTLNGTLPAQYGSWGSSIVAFQAQNNSRLRGTLPESFLSWGNVMVVDLADNALTGPLPAGWPGGMRSIMILNLERNMFSGTIPPSFGAFPKLQVLNLALNSLSGRVPEVVQWSSIAIVGLQNNSGLVGTIPTRWGARGVFSDVIRVLSVCGTGLCGNATELNLPLGFTCFTRQIAVGDALDKPLSFFQLMLSNAVFSMSKSCRRHLTITQSTGHDDASVLAPPPTPTNLHLARARTVAVYGSLVMSGLLNTGPQTSMRFSFLQSAVGASRLSKLCSLELSGEDPRESDLAPISDAAENPLQIPMDVFGEDRANTEGPLVAGALVGNTLLVVSYGVCVDLTGRLMRGIGASSPRHWVRYVLRFTDTIRRPQRRSIDTESLLPGTAAMPFFMFLQPTVVSALVLPTLIPTGGVTIAVAISALVLLLWCTSSAWVARQLLRHRATLHSHYDTHHTSRRRSNRPYWRHMWSALFTARGAWRSSLPSGRTSARMQKETWCSFFCRYGAFIEAYTATGVWYGAVDFLVILGCGIAQGIAVGTSGGGNACTALYWSTALIMLLVVVQLSLCLYFKPLVMRTDAVVVVALASVTLLSELLSLVGRADAADVVSTAAFFLQAFITVLLPLLSGWDASEPAPRTADRTVLSPVLATKDVVLPHNRGPTIHSLPHQQKALLSTAEVPAGVAALPALDPRIALSRLIYMVCKSQRRQQRRRGDQNVVH